MKIPLIHKRAPGNSLKILFIGSEVAPFAKVGGLGEVLYSLPKAMRELGADVRAFLPKYGSMDTRSLTFTPEIKNLHLSSRKDDPHGLLVCNVLNHKDSKKTITYFLENMEYFEKRANVYGYIDDTMRWVLLSRAVLEFIKVSKWKPDFIIANDWETGFVPNLLKTEYKDDPSLKDIKTIYCIHNLRNQGTFDASFVSEIDADFGRKAIPPFFSDMRYLNGMRRGILWADAIVTVSPTYAQEILSPEYGEKLDGVLQERRQDLFGILNGIDLERFNPSTDPVLAAHYHPRNTAPRSRNKTALQHRFGLEEKDRMIFGYNGRLDEQKGLSLLNDIMRPLLDNLDFQFVVVGTGDKRYKNYFKSLADAYPGRVGVHLAYDEELPHLIYGGADAMLIPSLFEPSGLVQMEAMRYGAIPLVRKTGGLADTVTDCNPEHNTGTGFVFEKFDPESLLITIVRAYESYRNKKEWRNLMERAMTQDFSWRNSARKYLALCRKLQGQNVKIN